MTEVSVFECGICISLYDGDSHKPLSLPCGHVFCEECMVRQNRNDEAHCPLDKTKCKVSELPCCYAILSNLPRSRPRPVTCSRHPKKRIKFQCKTHDLFLCSECIIDHTGVGHAVSSFSTTHTAVKREFDQYAEVFSNKAKTAFDSKKLIEGLEQRMKNLYDMEISKVNATYESAMKMLYNKRKEHIAFLTKQQKEQGSKLEGYVHKINKLYDTANGYRKNILDFKESCENKAYEDMHRYLVFLQRELKKLEDIEKEPEVEFYFFRCKRYPDNRKFNETSSARNSMIQDLNESSDSCKHANKRQHCHSCRHRKATNKETSVLKPYNSIPSGGLSPNEKGSVTSRAARSTSKNDQEYQHMLEPQRNSPQNTSRGRNTPFEILGSVPAKKPVMLRARQLSRNRMVISTQHVKKRNNSF
jgi:hypothetical protein